MIARIWSGATLEADADAYTEYLKQTGVMAYRQTPGNRGVLLFRTRQDEKMQFFLISLWDSISAIEAFAGSDYKRAVYYAEDQRFLVDMPEKVTHFEVVESDISGSDATAGSPIAGLDHIVLTVGSLARSAAFYEGALGMEPRKFEGEKLALHFGEQKINLHEFGNEFAPKAKFPTPGSADFCLLSSLPISEVAADLRSRGIEIIEGPVAQTGAVGMLESIYVRDPDGNLVEIANLAR
jgi:catechol 2,3-dioxygenase-like lactoylglutathione lyase family enzyme/heme-degrading monooxygenase HmoA